MVLLPPALSGVTKTQWFSMVRGEKNIAPDIGVFSRSHSLLRGNKHYTPAVQSPLLTTIEISDLDNLRDS